MHPVDCVNQPAAKAFPARHQTANVNYENGKRNQKGKIDKCDFVFFSTESHY